MIGGKSTRDVNYHTFGEALPATNSRYSAGVLDVDSLAAPGSQGMTVEGTIVQLRHHTVVDAKTTYHRFLAIVIDVKRGNNRTFDERGMEIETEQSRIARGRVGYSSWKETKIDDPNELTLANIAARFGKLGMHQGLLNDEQMAALHPHVPNRFELWADRKLVTEGKLEVGQLVRAKTKGASHIVETVWRADSTPLTAGTSYAGEEVGETWGNKIVAGKAHVQPQPEEDDDEDKDAVDSDEW